MLEMVWVLERETVRTIASSLSSAWNFWPAVPVLVSPFYSKYGSTPDKPPKKKKKKKSQISKTN